MSTESEPAVGFYPTTNQERAVLAAVYALRTAADRHHENPGDAEAKAAFLEASGALWGEIALLWMEAAA